MSHETAPSRTPVRGLLVGWRVAGGKVPAHGVERLARQFAAERRQRVFEDGQGPLSAEEPVERLLRGRLAQVLALGRAAGALGPFTLLRPAPLGLVDEVMLQRRQEERAESPLLP